LEARDNSQLNKHATQEHNIVELICKELKIAALNKGGTANATIFSFMFELLV